MKIDENWTSLEIEGGSSTYFLEQGPTTVK